MPRLNNIVHNIRSRSLYSHNYKYNSILSAFVILLSHHEIHAHYQLLYKLIHNAVAKEQ